MNGAGAMMFKGGRVPTASCAIAARNGSEGSAAPKGGSKHPNLAGTEQYRRFEYDIQYAALCREEGQLCSWKGPITALNLELELKSISEQFCGENVFGHTYLFEQFSSAQQRLLMFLFRELTKAWIRHRRRSFAIDRVIRISRKSAAPSS